MTVASLDYRRPEKRHENAPSVCCLCCRRVKKKTKWKADGFSINFYIFVLLMQSAYEKQEPRPARGGRRRRRRKVLTGDGRRRRTYARGAARSEYLMNGDERGRNRLVRAATPPLLLLTSSSHLPTTLLSRFFLAQRHGRAFHLLPKKTNGRRHFYFSVLFFQFFGLFFVFR